MNKTEDPSQATGDLDSLLGQVVDDYLQRLAGGERVDCEEYARAHPEIATLIRQTFPLFSMIRESSAGVALGDKPDLSSSRRLGDFQLLHELGSGGMGFVYEAEQLSLGRRVALKILPLAGALQQKSLQRFRNEVRAAAMLDHPHIVSIYSIGEERGVHYYAMQLIHGQTLAEVIGKLSQPLPSESPLNGNTISRILCADHPMSRPSSMESTCEFSPENDARSARGSVSTRVEVQAGTGTIPSLTPTSEFFRSVAELGVQGAEALQHAHDQGVIHRDIKPGNLMLDAHAQLYVTDFGLARIETDAALTMTGDLVGTLRYMSPEQALGKRVFVDHRSDIYSLGMTFYELLALRPAFDGTNRQELLNQIALDDPPRLRKVNRFVPRELETIIHKAIAKRPDDRYVTAQDFAEDLKCFLLDKPIRAKPASRFNQARKWARRHKEMVAAVAATLMVAAAIVGVLMWKERSDTFAALESRTAALADRDRALAQAKMQADIADRVSQHSQTLLYAADIKLAADAIANSDVPRAAELLQRHISEADNDDRRGFEWYYFHKQISLPLSAELHQGDWVNDLAISPDGRWLAATGSQGTVQIYEMETWKRQASLPTLTASVNGLAWSPDGNLLAAACSDGRIVVVGFPRGAEGSFTIPSHDGEANDVIFSPDGRTLYSCGDDHLAKSWDVETGTLRREFRGHGRVVERIALAPDGRLLATASSDQTFATWDTESGVRRQHWDFLTGRVVCVAFSPDGRQLAAGTIHGHLYVADTTTGTWKQWTKQLDGIEALMFLDAGRLLATADRGGALQLHSLTDAAASDSSRINEPSHRWVAHQDRAVALTATADGKTLVSGGRDGAARVWTPDLQATQWRLVNDFQRSDVTVGGKHRLYAAGYAISVWDLQSRRLVDAFGSTDPPWRLVECSADGRYLAAARVGQIALFDLDSQQVVETWSMDDRLDPHRLAVSHTGRWVAFTDNTDRELVVVYQRGVARSVRIFPALQSDCLAFAPDERLLAAGHKNDVRLFELHADREPRVLEGHSNTLSGLAFHPTGQLLATVGHDRILKVWRVATGELLYSIVAHRDWVRSVACSPDGKTIATAADDGQVRLWHTATGQPLGSLLPEAQSVRKIVFDPTGLQLVGSPGRHLAQTVVYDAQIPPSGTAPKSSGLRVLQTATAEFRGLGDLPGGEYRSIVGSISANGRFAVGHSFSARGFEPFLWSRAGGLRAVEDASFQANCQATCVSNDGRVLGGAGGEEGWQARIWTGPGAWQSIAPAWSHIEDISQDGTVAVGRHWAEDHWKALRWSSGTTEFLPASPEGHRHAEAVAIDPSGGVILGCVFNTLSTVSGRQRYVDSESIVDARPLIWNRDGVQVLPGLESGYNWWPFDISDEGHVIVGLRWPLGEHFCDSVERSSGSAFRWENGQVTLLGTLPGCQHSKALTISGDGQTIAGTCFFREQQNTRQIAFVWDAEHGMRGLSDVLARAGANPGGWLLQHGKALSYDGLSLVGQGENPQGRSEAWFARLPSE